MRQAFTPYRIDEVIALARATAERFRGLSIEEIAEQEGIILQLLADPVATKEGFCCVLSLVHPKTIASEAKTGAVLFSFEEEEVTTHPAIVINPARAGKIEEVFWHEYYHLLYSPSRPGGATFFGGYSTAGVLDKQEERRADVFAAFVLVPELRPQDTPSLLIIEHRMSERLAQVRIANR